MFKLFNRSDSPSPSSAPSATPAQACEKPNSETLADPSAGDSSGVKGAFSGLRAALRQTRNGLLGQLKTLTADASDKPLDAEALEAFEEALIRADFGVDLAVALAEQARQKGLSARQLKPFLREELMRVLGAVSQSSRFNELSYGDDRLNIYFVVGVNGAGKTTLIGKLAHRFVGHGKRVIIAAGDTFRAAAEEQLGVWAQRAGAELVQTQTNDAAAVVYDALRLAQDGVDVAGSVVIIDTAGRLQNKFNLMEELGKMKRIIDKEAPARHVYEALLVVDATTGQNALSQAKVFAQAVNLTGVALTKLDGSAKGGIAFHIAKAHQLPVKLVGVGEQIDDLKDFDAVAFIDGLLDEEAL
ncbi:MAG: signal recognition particle-docking protein FtsY [Cyanobacteria bacterium HKST-UBA03]|nr:signal recognition particle-docking protein FtsY [Cyanobacteria bacterium HKST-UBA03]